MLFLRTEPSIVTDIKKCIYRRGVFCRKKLSDNTFVGFLVMVVILIIYSILNAYRIRLIL